MIFHAVNVWMALKASWDMFCTRIKLGFLAKPNETLDTHYVVLCGTDAELDYAMPLIVDTVDDVIRHCEVRFRGDK